MYPKPKQSLFKDTMDVLEECIVVGVDPDPENGTLIQREGVVTSTQRIQRDSRLIPIAVANRLIKIEKETMMRSILTKSVFRK